MCFIYPSAEYSDTDLCHSLANLVAVVMGCPSRSNHLWFHIFAPEELVNTYMTGFMVSIKVISLFCALICNKQVFLLFFTHSTIQKSVLVVRMIVE